MLAVVTNIGAKASELILTPNLPGCACAQGVPGELEVTEPPAALRERHPRRLRAGGSGSCGPACL